MLPHSSPVAAVLALARQCQSAGQLAEAGGLYRQLLAREPDCGDALAGLGQVAYQGGDLEQARDCFQRVLRLCPADATTHFRLGNVYQLQGYLTAAVGSYRQAIRHQPAYAEAWCNLGRALALQGQLEAARVHLQQAVRLQPEGFEALCNLAHVYQAQSQLEAAREAYERALQLQPECGIVRRQLGMLLQTLGQLEAAAAQLEIAIQQCPTDTEAYYALGTVRQQQDELDAAILAYQAVLRLHPQHALAHYNLGVAYQAQHRLDEAYPHYQAALRLQPNAIDPLCNLAALAHEQGDFDAALAWCQAAIQQQADYPLAQWNRAIVWLSQGNLAQGWPAYEWRWAALQRAPRMLPMPQWDGTSLQGRTILVWAEQGVGDEVLFASCVPALLAHAAHVICQCDPRLAPLFARSFPTATIVATTRTAPLPLARLPACDVHCPLGSLPGMLRSTLGHFPLQVGYLQADPHRQALWQARLAALGPGLKVGLAWRSRRDRKQALHAYTTLADWQAVFGVPGLQWVNLQYDGAAAELASVEARWGVRVHTWADLDVEQDLDEVAALMLGLDIVLAPDTAVAQLGGAVGVPVWRLTVLGGEETRLGTDILPWFPTVRLYMQPRPGDWRSVLERLGHDLSVLSHSDTAPRDSLAAITLERAQT